jgi:hypothetical protein
MWVGCGGTEAGSSSTSSSGNADQGGSSTSSSSSSGASSSGASSSGQGGTPQTDGGANAACGAAVCTGWNKRSSCATQGGAVVWTEDTCPAGQGCVQGVCTASACSDECVLGDPGCKLFEVQSGAQVTPDLSKKHDRARAFEKWIRTDTALLFHNQIVYANYTDANLQTVNSVYIGDSTLHTGIYLFANAHDLMTTGSFAARKTVREGVELFHDLFGLPGDPGMLATSRFPAGDKNLRAWTGWKCTDFDRHCDVSYNGKKYDYVGQPSRDMYMGALLGLVASYDALGSFDEVHRKMIRKDLLEWAKELIKKRKVLMRLSLNGVKLPAQEVETRFFIPEKADMVDGAVTVTLNTNDLSHGEIRGGREFMPNAAVLFRKFSGLNSVPDVPFSTIGFQVGAIINAALHVTDGVPEHAQERAEILDFYKNNADEWGNAKTWLDIASKDSATERSCTAKYFGNGLSWIAAYTWGLLEKDPTLKADLVKKALGPKWDDSKSHKNSFFNFAYGAANKAGFSGTPLDEAVRQVENFPAPPRIRVAKTGGCAEQAVEIQDRPVVFLQWHTNPWNKDDVARPTQTFPGHDYLEAYWMGRSHGFVAEDTPGRCNHK